MDEIEKYKAQIAAYQARVDVFNAQMQAFAAQARNTIDQNAFDTLTQFTRSVRMGKVYEVHEAANGYFAQLESGKIVVGKTLAEVTTEANALVTEEMTAVNTDTPKPAATSGWTKGLLDALMKDNGFKMTLFSDTKLFPMLPNEVSGEGYARAAKFKRFRG